MTQASSKPGSVSIGRYDDLRQKERVVLDIDGTSVGVYFIGDEIRAWHNTCPHSGGPVCQGKTVPRTLQGVEEGTGIGLEMTKRLVELMGGRIGVDSVEAAGSTFWVELDV